MSLVDVKIPENKKEKPIVIFGNEYKGKEVVINNSNKALSVIKKINYLKTNSKNLTKAEKRDIDKALYLLNTIVNDSNSREKCITKKRSFSKNVIVGSTQQEQSLYDNEESTRLQMELCAESDEYARRLFESVKPDDPKEVRETEITMKEAKRLGVPYKIRAIQF